MHFGWRELCVKDKLLQLAFILHHPYQYVVLLMFEPLLWE